MISLKSIEIHHFRSFLNLPKFELPKFGLVLLQAQPFNGSTSGIGKSNLLKAISYGLTTGLLRENTKYWFSDTEDKLSVIEEFYVDNKVYKISRGTFKTELYIDGFRQEGGAKATNDILRKLFRLDFDLVETLTTRRQRRNNSFVSSTDAEKKEFLSRILGLEEIDELIKNSGDSIKKIEILIEQERFSKQNLDNELKTLIKPIAPNTNEIEYLTIQLNKDLELLKRAEEELSLKEHAKDSLLQLKANRMLKLPDVQNTKQSLKDAFIIDCLVFNQEILTYTEKKDKATARWSCRSSIIDQNSILNARLASLKAELCPECQRPWQDTENKINEYQNQLKVNKDKLAEIVELEPIIKDLSKAIKDKEILIADMKNTLNSELAKLDLKVETQKSLVINEYANQIDELQIDLIKNGIKDLNKVISDIKLKIKDLENIQNIFGLHLKTYEDKSIELKDKIKKCEINIDKMVVGMALEEDFKELIGRKGFLGLIIAEILNEISFNVNKILFQIPNTSEVSIQINTTHERENSIKPKINFLIYKRGMEVDLGGLSGGQQASLELAMDLALRKVIFQRLGIDLGWLILDEVFHGLSPIDKEAVFEILKVEAETKLVLVIDHDDKFENYFDKVITLKFDGEKTTIC